MDLANIILRCKNNERVAQNYLYNKYAPSLYSICLRYLKSSDVSQDVLVQGFYKILNNINDFKNEGSFEGWMKRIVINESLMELRKRKNFSLTIPIEEVNYQLEAEVNDQLSYEEILSMLDELPDGYRTVFNLYAIEGYKHREIAELLGISVNTSKSQLILARRKLQSIFKKKSLIKTA
jgi:RNA polymerase sigma factor (sigma-70 family)